MTLTACRRLQTGDFVFFRSRIWRVASPPLVRRRTGTKVRIERADGTNETALEIAPAALTLFGKRRRASRANVWLVERLAAIVAHHDPIDR